MDTKQDKMYQRIEKHGKTLCRVFGFNENDDPVKLCKRLFSLENKAPKATTDYCNGIIETEQWASVSDELYSKLEKIIGKCNIHKVFINTDARGYALKFTEEISDLYPELHKDWGGYGIIAPDFRE